MTTRFLISSFFFLTKFYAFGQFPLPASVFYSHTQHCNFFGTTETDFIIELFSDSTIKISEYKTSYLDQHNSVLRFTYYGAYKVTNDTLEIKYFAHKVDLKNRPQDRNGILRTKPSDRFIIYPSNTYFLRKDMLMATNDSFLELKKSSYAKANELDLIFDYWDTPTFNKREISEVTKN